MASDLERFVSDNAIRFFGLSDKSIVDYIIASASSSKTPDALFTALNAYGLPESPDAHSFTADLFKRAPRKHKHKKHHADDSTRKQAEKEAQALKSQKYSFVLEDD
ncbi:hypothetical protein JAAARDRAFT_84702, partial [Jaapia argillacea MUCL 33604]